MLLTLWSGPESLAPTARQVPVYLMVVILHIPMPCLHGAARCRRRLWHNASTTTIYSSSTRDVCPLHIADTGIRYSRVDRGRGQIALPFPPVPLQTVLATFMAHGSLVSLSLRLWPIAVDVHVAPPAEWDALAFACTHDLHPERFLPASSFVQVCQVAYVVHFHVLLASTYFAGIFE